MTITKFCTTRALVCLLGSFEASCSEGGVAGGPCDQRWSFGGLGGGFGEVAVGGTHRRTPQSYNPVLEP